MIIAPRTEFTVTSTNVEDTHYTLELDVRSSNADLSVYDGYMTISNPNYGTDFISPVHYNNPDDCKYNDIWYIITDDGYAIVSHNPYNGQSSAMFQIIENHGVVDCDETKNIKYVPLGTYIRKEIEFKLDDGIYFFVDKDVSVFQEDKVYSVGDKIVSYDTANKQLNFYKKIIDNSYLAPEAGAVRLEENTYISTTNYNGYVKWYQDVSTSTDKKLMIGLTHDITTTNGVDYLEYCNLVDWDNNKTPTVTTNNTDDDLVVRTEGGVIYYINMSKASEYQNGRSREKFFYNSLSSKYFDIITNDNIIFKISSLNKDLPFDTALNTQAVQNTSITYSLKVLQTSDVVTFGNIIGSSVEVVFKQSDGTIINTVSKTIDNSIDDTSNYKQGTTVIVGNTQSNGSLAPLTTNSIVDITITGTECKVGRIELGKSIDIGMTLLDFQPTLKDYSPMQVGKGGEIDYISGVAVYNVKSTVLFDSTNTDRILRLLKYIKKNPVAVDFSGNINAVADADNGVFTELQMIAYISSSSVSPKLTRGKDRYAKFFEVSLTFTELG